MSLKYEDISNIWIQERLLRPSLNHMSMAIKSSYLSQETIHEKVDFISKIVTQLYTFGSDKLKATIRIEIQPFLHLIYDHLNLLQQHCLDFYEIAQASDTSRIERLMIMLEELEAYTNIVKISVLSTHVQGHNNPQLEKYLKNVMGEVLKITSRPVEDKNNWSAFFYMYSTFTQCDAVLSAYSDGIMSNLKKGINYAFIPEDIFEIGKLLVQNTISYKPQIRPLVAPSPTSSDRIPFFCEHVKKTNINELSLMSQYKIMGALVTMFQFDPQMKRELAQHNLEIARKAEDLIDTLTEGFVDSLLRLLKQTYIPVHLANLEKSRHNREELLIQMNEYHLIVKRVWQTIKNQYGDYKPEAIQEFTEFAFSVEVMEFNR